LSATRDRLGRRGYDYDATAPSRREYLESQGILVPDTAPSSRMHPALHPRVAAEITRIEPQALALGWPAWRLWGAEFWPGPRGLAAILDPGDQLVEVVADHMTIERGDARRTRETFLKSHEGAANGR
jgi:hypothetical protein